MKSLIVFYSYSGNTRQVAQVLQEYCSRQGEAGLLALTALDETKSFLGQCFRAFTKTRAKIAQGDYDLSGYDRIAIGTPVWAFKPAPAVNAFLDACRGIKGKEIVLFCTYGSGTGKDRCVGYMKELLVKKGVKRICSFSIPQSKVKDQEFVLSEIKKIA